MIEQYIEGEWLYCSKEKTLKHIIGNTENLQKAGLLDAEGYLSDEFKEGIRKALGESVLEGVQGPFGDDDIFSGDITDETTWYNIELHHISENNMDALQNLSGVHLKIENTL